jgi:hypothetical protein
MISYVLDKDIPGEKILQDIQNLIAKFKSSSQDKIPILYIDIRTISHDDASIIPKIECKKSVDCST